MQWLNGGWNALTEKWVEGFYKIFAIIDDFSKWSAPITDVKNLAKNEEKRRPTTNCDTDD